MKTAITELFGIQYPLLNAGMGRVAFPNMVAAVSNAGGLGVYGAGSNPPEVTRAAIREIRALTDKPFGANAPLALPNGMANAKVMLEEGVPVINYSMGKGDWIVKAAHAYGGKVMASVSDVRLAQRAEAHGCDAVIAAGYEAAGHAGEIGSFVLIPRLAELLGIPIIAAGGVANGAGLVGALALGASGVSMGTRFWVTQEGPMHANFKNKALELDVQDTIFSDRFDGIPCRQMKTAAAERMVNAKMLNIWEIFLNSFTIAKELNTPWLKLVKHTLSLGPRQIESMMRMSKMLQMHGLTMSTGDLDKGMTASGQSVGLVHDLPTIDDLIKTIIAEAEAVQRRLALQIPVDGVTSQPEMRLVTPRT
ncbi:NAD(P)H-dependent flavin oxidoreductase [Pseudomonas sp. NPDC089392]|uniref:NAD(P)H-dependent flavin oxidoreductase n=1 Tax=Pseudomonas sp. NPDC089392 TaxID=3364459 RepID=UPI00382323B2